LDERDLFAGESAKFTLGGTYQQWASAIWIGTTPFFHAFMCHIIAMGIQMRYYISFF
jgi:hypothetical protein